MSIRPSLRAAEGKTNSRMGGRGRTGLRALLIALCFSSALPIVAGAADGDFGRSRSIPLFADVHRFLGIEEHRWVGGEAAKSVGVAPSNYPLTEDERLLRDLAYPFIEPPGKRPFLTSVFGEYLSYSPPWLQNPPFDRSAYGRALLAESRAAINSRYGQLNEDIRNDVVRVEPFARVASRVLDMDAKRRASMRYVSDLSPQERGDAHARMRENVLIVQWVQQCIQRRAASYRWAMEHLVVAAPDPMAADVDRSLLLLEATARDSRLNQGGVEGVALRVGG